MHQQFLSLEVFETWLQLQNLEKHEGGFPLRQNDSFQNTRAEQAAICSITIAAMPEMHQLNLPPS
jgi:hypothetical protein